MDGFIWKGPYNISQRQLHEKWLLKYFTYIPFQIATHLDSESAVVKS